MPLQVPHEEVAHIIEGLKDGGAEFVRIFRMGECSIIISREPAALDCSHIWHLSISRTDRHPNWDEIKAARYWLLPEKLTFGMLLPPPENYINVPQQDHVFHLYEITDPREPWTAG